MYIYRVHASACTDELSQLDRMKNFNLLFIKIVEFSVNLHYMWGNKYENTAKNKVVTLDKYSCIKKYFIRDMFHGFDATNLYNCAIY